LASKKAFFRNSGWPPSHFRLKLKSARKAKNESRASARDFLSNPLTFGSVRILSSGLRLRPSSPLPPIRFDCALTLRNCCTRATREARAGDGVRPAGRRPARAELPYSTPYKVHTPDKDIPYEKSGPLTRSNRGPRRRSTVLSHGLSS